MATKTKMLGVDKQGVQKVMKKSDYLIDGLGQVAINAIGSLTGMLTYFYTDKVGISAAVVANVLIVTKIVDAFTNLIMGRIMDNGKSKYGKAKPWFLRMSIPVLVGTAALFTIPKTLTGLPQLLYLLVTNILVSSVISTAISVPYAALLVYRTRSMEERGTMGIVRAGFGYLVGMIIAIGLIPISNMLGGDQAAWIKLGAIFGVIAAVCLFVLFKKTKEVTNVTETGEQVEEEQLPFGQALSYLFKNRYWLALSILCLFSNINFGIAGASGAYYAKWVLGDDNLVGLMGAVGLIPSLGGFLILGPMIKKFGQTKTMQISLGLGVIAFIVWLFKPDSLIMPLTCGLFTTFATIPVMALTGPMTAMTIDYNDYKFGHKMTGISNSAQSFGGKVSGGLGASIIGWSLAIGGYSAVATTQSTSAIYAIYAFTIIIPMITTVAMFFLVRYLSPLEKEYPSILEEIQKRDRELAASND